MRSVNFQWAAFASSVTQISFASECIDSTPTKTIERVCVSPTSKEQICLLCAKDIVKKDFIGHRPQTKVRERDFYSRGGGGGGGGGLPYEMVRGCSSSRLGV